MSKSSFIHARIEPTLKSNVEKVLSQLGVTPSQLITMIYANIASTHEIPIHLKIPNEETRRVLEESDKGIGIHKCEDFNDFCKQTGIT